MFVCNQNEVCKKMVVCMLVGMVVRAKADSAISCPQWASVYKCQRVECAFTSPGSIECGMFVMCCMQCCMSLSAVL